MADSAANLKVNATMDNSDLKKKCKESKDALRDFSQASEDAVSKIGDAFGVNTDQIDKMLSSVRGLGVKLQDSANTGVAAFGKLLTSVNGFTAALAGIGIAGVVAGFKVLNEEATAFKNTLAGANIDTMTSAYVDTYRQVLHDFNAATGRNVAQAEASWRKSWNTFLANLKFNIVNMDFGTAIAGPLIPALFGGGNSEAIQQATAAATEAERISGRIFKIQRQIADKTVEWARTEREIAEQKRIAYDKTNDTATRIAALAKAEELIRNRYKEEAILRGQLADLQEQYNSLAESSLTDIDKANQLRIQEEDTLARMNNKLIELSEKQATLTANAQKEAQARMEALDAYEKMALSRADLEEWASRSPAQIKMPTQAEAMNTPGLAIPVTPVLDTSSVVDITNDLQQMLVSSFETMGVAIGELVADLATGGDAWGNFVQTAVSALGDMAIQVGKIAIETGVAMLAIKAALNFGGPWGAIAAGTALVALGAAIKVGLSNVAQGGSYSASTGVASASGHYGSSSFGTAFDTREMNIKVTGNLYASGNQLVAVIENENNRRNHTT